MVTVMVPSSGNLSVGMHSLARLNNRIAGLQDAEPEQLEEVKAVAADAVSSFIRNMDTFQFDLLENPAVQQLKGDSQYGTLFRLLELMLAGNMKVRYQRVRSRLQALLGRASLLLDQILLMQICSAGHWHLSHMLLASDAACMVPKQL